MSINSVGMASYSLATLNELREKLIKQTDKNGDGTLDSSELSRLAQSQGQSADALIATYDKNKSRNLDAAESKLLAESLLPDDTFSNNSSIDDSTGSASTDLMQRISDAMNEPEGEERKAKVQTLLAEYVARMTQLSDNGIYGTTSAVNDATGGLFDIQA